MRESLIRKKDNKIKRVSLIASAYVETSKKFESLESLELELVKGIKTEFKGSTLKPSKK